MFFREVFQRGFSASQNERGYDPRHGVPDIGQPGNGCSGDQGYSRRGRGRSLIRTQGIGNKGAALRGRYLLRAVGPFTSQSL